MMHKYAENDINIMYKKSDHYVFTTTQGLLRIKK